VIQIKYLIPDHLKNKNLKKKIINKKKQTNPVDKLKFLIKFYIIILHKNLLHYNEMKNYPNK